MTTLHRTVTLVHVNIVSELVTKDLNLYVTRSHHIFLKNHVIIIKTLHALALSCIKLVHELGLSIHDAHTFATASKRCL